MMAQVGLINPQVEKCIFGQNRNWLPIVLYEWMFFVRKYFVPTYFTKPKLEYLIGLLWLLFDFGHLKKMNAGISFSEIGGHLGLGLSRRFAKVK